MSAKNPYAIKMDTEILQQYLAFRNKQGVKPAKKGKEKKYSRNDFKKGII